MLLFLTRLTLWFLGSPKTGCETSETSGKSGPAGAQPVDGAYAITRTT